MKMTLVFVAMSMMTGLAAAAPPHAVSCPAAAAAGEPQRTRLKALLQTLALQRGFRLEYWAADDPEVVHSGGSDTELMTALAEQANLIVRYASAGARCPGQWKIDTVWVLPVGKPAPPPPDAGALAYWRAHSHAPPPAPEASAAAP